MERDNFKCCWCTGNKSLVVHHHQRTFVDIVTAVRARLPTMDGEALLDAIVAEHKLEDGVTLCKKCHDAYHKEKGK